MVAGTKQPPWKGRSLFGDARGAVLLEFAIITPIFLVLVVGGFEITRFVNVQTKVNDIAESIAQSMDAICFLDTSTLTSQILTAVDRTAYGLDRDKLGIEIYNVSRTSADAVAINWSWADGPGDSTLLQGDRYRNLVDPGESLFVVEVNYQFEPSASVNYIGARTIDVRTKYFPQASVRPFWLNNNVFCRPF